MCRRGRLSERRKIYIYKKKVILLSLFVSFTRYESQSQIDESKQSHSSCQKMIRHQELVVLGAITPSAVEKEGTLSLKLSASTFKMTSYIISTFLSSSRRRDETRPSPAFLDFCYHRLLSEIPEANSAPSSCRQVNKPCRGGWNNNHLSLLINGEPALSASAPIVFAELFISLTWAVLGDRLKGAAANGYSNHILHYLKAF